MKLAVIIPVFDEENGIADCVLAITTELAATLPECHLIIVDDGSTDKTIETLQCLQKEFAFTLLRHSENQGYGKALLTGAEYAYREGFEFALFMDSDLTNHPRFVSEFATVIATEQWDLVKASRYVKGGGMSGVPWYRRTISRLGNRLASCLFGMGLHDCTNGFRAVRLSLLHGLVFKERGFAAIMEELYWMKVKHARVTEIPSVLTSRSKGRRRTSFSYSPRTFWNYLKYALRAASVKN